MMVGVINVLTFVLLVLLCVAIVLEVIMFIWVVLDATDFGYYFKKIGGWVKKRRMKRPRKFFSDCTVKRVEDNGMFIIGGRANSEMQVMMDSRETPRVGDKVRVIVEWQSERSE